MGLRALFFLVSIFSFSSFCNAKSAENWIPRWENIEQIEYAKSDTLNLNNIDDLNFERLNSSALNLGFYKGGVWLKFDLEFKGEKLLVLGNPILDEARLFRSDTQGLRQVCVLGDYWPFSERDIKDRKPVVKLQSDSYKKQTFYLYVQNSGEQFYLNLSIWDKQQYDLFVKIESYLWGGYLGILLFVLVFNTVIAIGLKERNIFYYIVYLVGLILLQLSLNGFGIMWFWGDSISFAAKSTILFSSLSILFLSLFAQSFLAVKNYLPLANKVLNFAQVLIAVNIVATFILSKDELQIPILFINVITFLFGITIIPIAYKILKMGFKAARYFLLAFISLIILVFAFVLRNIGVIPNNFISENGLQIGSVLEVILITFAIVDKFKTFRDKAITRLQELNTFKNQANEVLEQKVNDRTKELSVQKNLLKEKNEEILDSINYAKRIQDAILPPLKEIQKGVIGAFVFFKPKDIVSGDFYWVSHFENYSYYVVADCTGHGVPGAFMSMIGNALLNQIVNEKGIREPADILDKLRAGVIDSLSQNKERVNSNDGMDICLVKIDRLSNHITYSGANNGLIIIRALGAEEEGMHLKDTKGNKGAFLLLPNKQPIGGFHEDAKAFFQTSISIKKGDQLFLYTDGMPDQFGGEKGKKLKLKGFRNLLLEISENDFNENTQNLEVFYKKWVADSPYNDFQVDDVCVLGIAL